HFCFLSIPSLLDYTHSLVSSLLVSSHFYIIFLFFFNDTATTEIYTLSLHDALPIYNPRIDELLLKLFCGDVVATDIVHWVLGTEDRKSTRLNSSHVAISYAVFCLKKKKICKKPIT